MSHEPDDASGAPGFVEVPLDALGGEARIVLDPETVNRVPLP